VERFQKDRLRSLSPFISKKLFAPLGLTWFNPSGSRTSKSTHRYSLATWRQLAVLGSWTVGQEDTKRVANISQTFGKHPKNIPRTFRASGLGGPTSFKPLITRKAMAHGEVANSRSELTSHEAPCL